MVNKIKNFFRWLLTPDVVYTMPKNNAAIFIWEDGALELKLRLDSKEVNLIGHELGQILSSNGFNRYHLVFGDTGVAYLYKK